MIYTRNGDDGKTTLCGQRISKASEQCELLGSLDELNCLIGLCKVKARDTVRMIAPEVALDHLCEEIQHILFVIQAHVAGFQKPLNANTITWLEDVIASMEKQAPMPDHFVCAGGTELSALFDYARTVVRRTERNFVRCYEYDMSEINKTALTFLNRLSSVMFVAARFVNCVAHVEEVQPHY